MTSTLKTSPPNKVSPTLGRTLFGQQFQNPVLLAAGTAGFGNELAGVLDVTSLGGLITKSISLHPRTGNQPPRVTEFRGGMLNSVGLANPGVARVVADDLPRLLGLAPPARVLVSIVGFQLDEYAAVIDQLTDQQGIAALELNLSCPNTAAGGIEFGADPASIEAVVSSCRAHTTLPLIVKLSPISPDIGVLARAAAGAGADAVSVVNTMPGRLLGWSGHPKLGAGRGGVSGPALFPIGLQATAVVLESTDGLPVIGVGGVRSADDLRQYLRVGASLVQVGTAALADPRLPERLVRDLELNGV
jgi:dihydroorotate dehydrogenase (NAD+) catalytic subunit